MSYLMAVNPSPLRVMRQRPNEPVHSNLRQPTILVATVDPAISANMRDLLNMYPVKTIWAKGVDEVRSALAVENVAACFCGFWLVDGTYRDVVRHLKNQPVEIPAIIVCAPACPNEYRDYLAALNIRAFDVICYPYRKADMERILRAATSERNMFGRLQEPDAISSSVVERHSDLRKAG
jgi:DNA-binding NtrC family response regulator